MRKPFQRTPDDHPTPDTLLLALDGQLDVKEARRVSDHLAGCWECRTRQDTLQAGIAAFVEHRAQATLPLIPPPPGNWRSFEPRLQQLVEGGGDRSRETGLTQFLRSPFRLSHVSVVAGALLVAIALVAIVRRSPVVSAAELLDEASRLEASTVSSPDVVIHRSVRIEERRQEDGRVLGRRRIETWQQGKGVKARRVYDEQDVLIAGEWTGPTGPRTRYRRGTKSTSLSMHPEALAPSLDVIVWLDPSASDFTRLIGDVETLAVDTADDHVRVIYEVERAATGLIRAELTLHGPERRPIAQTLVLRSGGETRVYRFEEAAFDRLPANGVDRARFEPDAELIDAPESRGESVSAARRVPAARAPAAGLTAIEVDALEIELLYRLHQIESCLRWPPTVGRTDSGVIQVEAHLRTDECRLEAQRRFSSLTAHRAVAIALDVDTTEPVTGEAAAPLAPGDPADRGARQRAVWMLARSREAVEDARALDALAMRWSLSDLQALDVDRVAQWQSMIRDHAAAVQRAAEAMLLQVRQGPSPSIQRPGQTHGGTLTRVSEVPAAIARLVNAVTAHHESLTAASLEAAAAPDASADSDAVAARVRRIVELAASFAEPWSFER